MNPPAFHSQPISSPMHLTMNHRLIVLILALSAAFAPPGRADLIHTSPALSVPLSFDGEYLNVSTGATSSSLPGDWDTAPWMNPFFGGVYVANSPLFLPLITGTDQIVKLSAGALIDSTRTFAPGESVSSTLAAGQFQIGVPGLMGFKFQSTPGGANHFGWLRMTVNNAGAGEISEVGYESTPGLAVLAGSITSVPEPSEALVILLLGLPGATLFVRRRCRARSA